MDPKRRGFAACSPRSLRLSPPGKQSYILALRGRWLLAVMVCRTAGCELLVEKYLPMHEYSLHTVHCHAEDTPLPSHLYRASLLCRRRMLQYTCCVAYPIAHEKQRSISICNLNYRSRQLMVIRMISLPAPLSWIMLSVYRLVPHVLPHHARFELARAKGVRLSVQSAGAMFSTGGKVRSGDDVVQISCRKSKVAWTKTPRKWNL